MDTFWLSFIPLFVAFDVLGVLPLYIRLSANIDRHGRSRHLRDSMLTAFFITVVFVFVGNRTMKYLGISLSDFLIAGGIVLFIIAAKDIIRGHDEEVSENEMFGVVPLGVPLLAGPAVLATSVIVLNQYGYWYFLLSLVLNLAVCAVVLHFSPYILTFLGKRFVEAISKVFSLIIASIAIMFIRTGLQGL